MVKGATDSTPGVDAGRMLGNMAGAGVVSPGRAGQIQEVYRVRLPQNPFTGRGVVVGEGKPENQNHAVIFAFGEALQAVDINQVRGNRCEIRCGHSQLGNVEVWTVQGCGSA